MKVDLKSFLEDINSYIPDDAKIICVAGGSGSGKSFIAKKIAEKIGARVLAIDDYIIPEKITKDNNWDLPECWNLNLLDANLRDFLIGKEFRKPVYDFKKGIISKYETFESGGKLVMEGLHALHNSIIEHMNFSIFIESPESVRLARIVKRNLLERNHSDEAKIVKRWNEVVQPTFENLVLPQKEKADLIILN